MWGNSLGWGIAAVLVVITSAVTSVFNMAASISPPTSFSSEANLAPLQLPAAPDWIVDQTDPSADAGPLYRQALNLWPDARDEAEAYARKPNGPPPAVFDLLLKATHLSRMTLFTTNPKEVINYDFSRPALTALKEMGNAAATCGLVLHQRKDDAGARKYYEAVFALGANLYRERLVQEEYGIAEGFLSGQAQNLAKLEPPEGERAVALRNFATQTLDYDQQHVTPIWAVIDGADARTVAVNAGDVFRFARFAQERMWRIEATLKLGRYKFDAARLGDQEGAARWAARLAHDPDPAVAAAGAAARDLTVEQYHKIH